MKNKKIIALVAAILVVAIAVSAVFIFGGKQDYMKNESTVQFISTSIRVLKDSQFKDRDLIKEIYANAFYKKPVINNNFPEKLEETLPSLMDGTATPELYKAVVEGLYGGRALYNLSWSSRTRLAKEHYLVVGDILIRKRLGKNQVFIYAGEGKFYNLSDGCVVDEYTAAKRLEASLSTENVYTVLRPSFGMN